MHSFNQNANQITIVYKCSCGTINTETIDNLPMANMAADNASIIINPTTRNVYDIIKRKVEN